MKPANQKKLETLGDVLRQLRAHGAIVARTPSLLYFKSKAFLHVHEDPSGLFADAKTAKNYTINS